MANQAMVQRPSDQPLYDYYWGSGFLPSRFQGVRFRNASERVLDVALDGEIAARIPAAFEVASEGLRVVTPLTFAGGHR